MAISVCRNLTNAAGFETMEYPSAQFPAICYANAADYALHWHNELEIALVTEGETTLRIADGLFLLRQGDGFFVNAGALHGIRTADASCRMKTVVFHPRLVGGEPDSVFWQKYVRPLTANPAFPGIVLQENVPWRREARAEIARVWQLCAEEPEGYENELRFRLTALLDRVRRNALSAASPESADMLRKQERLKHMLQFIHDHLGEHLELRRIAAAAAVGESECLRCFRRVLGVSPMQYVLSARLQRAAGLLLATDEKISVIARQCGFDDSSYFGKRFQEKFHCTPSAYRNRNTA